METEKRVQHRKRPVGDAERRLASVSARNSRHLWTIVSDASGREANSFVAVWCATMASDSGRRPKGVVVWDCMTFCLVFPANRAAPARVQAKEIRSPKRRRLLTVIRGSGIL